MNADAVCVLGFTYLQVSDAHKLNITFAELIIFHKKKKKQDKLKRVSILL